MDTPNNTDIKVLSKSLDPLTQTLLPLFANALRMSANEIRSDTDFFQIGGDEESCSVLVDELRKRVDKYIYPVAVYEDNYCIETVPRTREYAREKFVDPTLVDTKAGNI